LAYGQVDEKIQGKDYIYHMSKSL